jgi:hypothetical protein
VVYNAILDSYQAHLAAAALRDGGESAELLDLCNALATMVVETVGALPLDPPLAHGWGYPIKKPNGEWPNWIVMEDPDQGSARAGYNSCWEVWAHHLVGFLICGPANGDPATLQGIGAQYKDPINRAIQANQSLGGRCNRIDVGRFVWRTIDPYAGGKWQGYYVPLTVEAQSLWTRS